MVFEWSSSYLEAGLVVSCRGWYSTSSPCDANSILCSMGLHPDFSYCVSGCSR